MPCLRDRLDLAEQRLAILEKALKDIANAPNSGWWTKIAKNALKEAAEARIP